MRLGHGWGAWTRQTLGALALVSACGLSACLPAGGRGGDGGDGGGPQFCEPGERRCECRDDGTCDDGLSCSAGRLCVDLLCSDGQEDCACGEGDTCNDGLVCNGLICVEDDDPINNPLPDAGGDDAGGGGDDAGGDEDSGGGGQETGLSAPSVQRFEVGDASEESVEDIRFENVGDEALTITRVRVEPQGGAFELPNAVPVPFVVAPGSFFEVSVIAQSGYGNATAELFVEAAELDDWVVVELEREVLDSTNQCPEAIAGVGMTGGTPATSTQVQVGQRVDITGLLSTDADGSVADYQWALVTRPGGSTASISQMGQGLINIFPDVPGIYAIDLQVLDDQGLISCNTARVTITATGTPVTPGEILVDITWDTPADMNQSDIIGADMDIHYLHPLGSWDKQPYDIYWNNKGSDWGVPGVDTDNPSLDIDDTDGVGPERVRHPNPAEGIYRVGVYYYSDNGFGGSYVTTQVRVGGMLVFEFRDKYMERENTFYRPADLAVDASGNVTVTDPMIPVRQGFPMP